MLNAQDSLAAHAEAVALIALISEIVSHPAREKAAAIANKLAADLTD